MDSIPFVADTDAHHLPSELLRKSIVRTKILNIRRINQNNHGNKRLYLGIYSGANHFDKPRNSEAVTAFFDELVDVYLEIYGNAPWNEFLSCSKDNCYGKKSISDVHGTFAQKRIALTELETKKPTRPGDHACPICGSSMEFYYPPERIIETLKSEFNRETIAVFLFNQCGRIEGFSWAWFGTIDTITRKLMTQLKCSKDSPVVASTKSFFESSQRERMLFLSEWAVSYAYRNTALPLLLLSSITFFGNERAIALGDSNPVIVGVSFDSSSATNAYRRFGASTVFHDPKTNVVVLATPIQRALEHYVRVERVLTKRLLRDKRRKSVSSNRKRVKIAV